MKNISFFVLICFVLIFSFSCSEKNSEVSPNNSFTATQSGHLNKVGRIRVDFHITTDDGCDVHIMGTVEVDIFGRIKVKDALRTFQGSVKISGGPCPTITLNFTSKAIPNDPSDLKFDLNNSDICSANDVSWSSDQSTQAVSILNQSSVRVDFVTNLQNSVDCD